ncbi:probable tRNA (uracil-O(2)-)-methyltransferase [Nilaparvata lugens]|uniref:probable tRNA (uracil-O(2)-)-methyltransferase n=1 Tax=Nilaparvata lugens TaxID=108931 RepID=UPI00193CF8E4|nr:probable tRNA (uracil-O(2)-)-methyltransferase [Nilaparvata lugens]XP_022190681.2 probable tRNA (uracil-O(2)-)-methyltransferase [Nilaparvata lugens]
MYNSNWSAICSVESTVASDQFWTSIRIWNDRPHIINRRLLAVEVLKKFRIETQHLDNIVSLLKDSIRKSILSDSKSAPSGSHLEEILKGFPSLNILTNDSNVDDFEDDREKSVVCEIRKLLPRFKNHQENTIELSIFDQSQNHATYIKIYPETREHSVSPNCNYRLEFSNGMFMLSVGAEPTGNVDNRTSETEVCKEQSKYDFLKKHLLPKLVQLAENVTRTGPVKSSLQLVSVNKYCLLYQNLKDKYGKLFVEIWPERTDPSKFVYEDIAIAAYLILLWEESKQRFVDLGCGNGLLVYILTSEGNQGYGVDVRPRKIWDLYSKLGSRVKPDLRIGTVTPSDMTLYSDTDWLIGNHSDELTPWIPVFAAKSSYSCNFFLLPCCPYEFNGQKYQRKDPSCSRYMEYISYIKHISEQCSFNVSIDKMRIPSTKRICLIGSTRSCPREDYDSVIERIDSMIKDKCVSDNKSEMDFKPRASVEKVTNCTQVDKNIVSSIVSLITRELLSNAVNSSENSKSVVNISGSEVNNKSEVNTSKSRVDTSGNISRIISNEKSACWNAGRTIALNELAKIIPKEHLVYIKKEGKGLLTLLRNHHHIFEVNNGNVCFRIPLPVDKNLNNASIKSKPCWFYNNHPNSCLLNEADCKFQHIHDEDS